MGRALRNRGLVIAGLCLLATACEPYSERPSTPASSAASAWSGTYEGDAVFTSPASEVYGLDVEVTIHCTPSASDVHVELHVSPRQTGYTPSYNRTNPVNNANSMTYSGTTADYVYRADLSHMGDDIAGELKVCDRQGNLIWKVGGISAER